MLLRRFYDEGLSQASYLIGCQATGEALIVDANRDIEQYIVAAQAESLRIAHVTETHIHADFVSGSRELAQRTGATLYLSDEGGPDWQYSYAAQAGAVLLKNGSRLQVGNVTIEALHTPGHTPEHLALLVTDTPAASAPLGVLSGDFVFVGDVGRPDLLERAVKRRGTMEQGARQLFRSLQRFKQFPDYLQIWPGHGAGSACGKALGAMPQSTLGYERLANWAFAFNEETPFVAAVLDGQPDPPRYFAEMKRINKEGPRVLGGRARPRHIPASGVGDLLAAGTLVVDTRLAAAFATAHIPGTINIPLNRAFTSWAGWLVPYDRDFYLVIDSARGEAVETAVRDLTMIGLDRVAGYLDGAEALEAWRASGEPLGVTPQMTIADLRERLGRDAVTVIDVRARAEWEAGHLPGVPNIPLGLFPDRLDELPARGPIVLHCETASRSAIAASLLQARGRRDVANLMGGFTAWQRAGYPIEVESPIPS